MALELIDLYSKASAWTNDKVAGAVTQLDAETPCDDWDVRNLLDHMLETQRYFLGAARGEDASPPSPTPPELITDDPAADFDRTRDDMLQAFGQPGVVDKTGPALGIAFSDQLLHGWDLARATGQDDTMPEGLPGAAYEVIHGRFTDDEHGRASSNRRSPFQRLLQRRTSCSPTPAASRSDSWDHERGMPWRPPTWVQRTDCRSWTGRRSSRRSTPERRQLQTPTTPVRPGSRRSTKTEART